jgi:hypothetical protein
MMLAFLVSQPRVLQTPFQQFDNLKTPASPLDEIGLMTRSENETGSTSLARRADM